MAGSRIIIVFIVVLIAGFGKGIIQLLLMLQSQILFNAVKLSVCVS